MTVLPSSAMFLKVWTTKKAKALSRPVKKGARESERRQQNRPANASRRVVFPDPDGPMIALILPGSAYPWSLSSNLLVCPSPKFGSTTVKSSHTSSLCT
ncbi:hypothetical protein LINGRAHAP2_LOCUS22289 [Linum grandiflorum]